MAAVVRMPILPPSLIIVQAYALTDLIGLVAFGYYTWKHRRLNKVLAGGLTVLIVSQPLRIMLAGTQPWLSAVAWVAGWFN